MSGQQKKDDNEAPDFSDVVRRLRVAELGMNQSEFADKLDVSVQTVSRWENGRSVPQKSRMAQLVRLADEYGAEGFLEALAKIKNRQEEQESTSRIASTVGSVLTSAAIGGSLLPVLASAISSVKNVNDTNQESSDEKTSIEENVDIVQTMLQKAAGELDVDIDSLKSSLRPPIRAAANAGMSASDLLKILRTEDMKDRH